MIIDHAEAIRRSRAYLVRTKPYASIAEVERISALIEQAVVDTLKEMAPQPLCSQTKTEGFWNAENARLRAALERIVSNLHAHAIDDPDCPAKVRDWVAAANCAAREALKTSGPAALTAQTGTVDDPGQEKGDQP